MRESVSAAEIALFTRLWHVNQCGNLDFSSQSAGFPKCDVDVAIARKYLFLMLCSTAMGSSAKPHPFAGKLIAHALTAPIYEGLLAYGVSLPMIYLVALLLPPLALLLYGKVFQAIINLVIYILAWIVFIFSLFLGGSPGFVLWLIAAIHAILAINDAKKNARAVSMLGGHRD